MPVRQLIVALLVGISMIGWLGWISPTHRTLMVQDPATRAWHAVAHLPAAACAVEAETISTLRPRVSTRCD